MITRHMLDQKAEEIRKELEDWARSRRRKGDIIVFSLRVESAPYVVRDANDLAHSVRDMNILDFFDRKRLSAMPNVSVTLAGRVSAFMPRLVRECGDDVMTVGQFLEKFPTQAALMRGVPQYSYIGVKILAIIEQTFKAADIEYLA